MKKRLWIMLIAMIMLAGCGIKDGNGGRQYVYNDKHVIDGLSVSKSVYDEDALYIYMSGDIDETFSVICYDEEFQRIDTEWETSYKDGKYTIQGENVQKISGICLSNDIYKYYIRYLDSDQYAIYSDSWADDLGWTHCEGDETLYYTQEELDEQQAKDEKAQRQLEETFAQFEGMWVAEDDPNAYVKFYYEDTSRRMEICTLNREGEYVREECSVDDMVVSEDYDGKVLTIYDGIPWGCMYEFKLSEDMNSFSKGYGDNIIYVRQ